MARPPAHHDLDLYGARVHIAATAKQWADVAAQVGRADESKPEAAGHTSFSLWVPKQGVSVPHLNVYVSRKDHVGDIAALINTITHEADHAAGMLLDHCGEKYDGHSEAHAYLVGWFAERIWLHLNPAA